MHLHFVQSLEPLQGAGLGQAALSLHLAMNNIKNYKYYSYALNHSEEDYGQNINSLLLTTKSHDFLKNWPNVIQGVRKGPSRVFYSPELVNLARKAVSEADIFHGHGLYVWLNFWFGREARINNKNLIYHPHGFFDPWILKRSRLKKLFVNMLFENKNIKYVKYWRALTLKEADQIRKIVGDDAKIEVIPNGISADESTGNEIPSKSDLLNMNYERINLLLRIERENRLFERRKKYRLLFLSRLHPKKGLDILIQAWAELKVEIKNWELLIVGPHLGNYREILETMVTKFECDDSCRIFSGVTGPIKDALFLSSDLFVLPSYSEGFPMVILEAAVHGLPIIQTTECNFNELTHCGAAWECEPNKADLLKAMRIAMESDESERDARGRQAKALVMEKYSWDKVALQIDELGRS